MPTLSFITIGNPATYTEAIAPWTTEMFDSLWPIGVVMIGIIIGFGVIIMVKNIFWDLIDRGGGGDSDIKNNKSIID